MEKGNFSQRGEKAKRSFYKKQFTDDFFFQGEKKFAQASLVSMIGTGRRAWTWELQKEEEEEEEEDEEEEEEKGKRR